MLANKFYFCINFLCLNIFLKVDAGGPTTEYFFYLMDELTRGNLSGLRLFEGQPGHLVPRFDYDIISGNIMKLVGRMILHSVFNHCRGLSGLSPAAVSYILSGTRDAVLDKLDIEDIPDPCLRESLREVQYRDTKYDTDSFY